MLGAGAVLRKWPILTQVEGPKQVVEQLAAVIPFVRAALKRGERCIYIVDEDPAAKMEAFRDAGIPVDEVIGAGAIVVLTKWDT